MQLYLCLLGLNRFKLDQFVGKVIQYIRAIDNTLVSRPYQTQPNYNNTGRGVEEWENTTEKIIKAPQNAILGQNE